MIGSLEMTRDCNVPRHFRAGTEQMNQACLRVWNM
uniref:Uncharacterized protein n=1 Tax=Globisporangium ultimum (strain ATCC 200006 / CBS 805.95 / DAOM BR144) TaxID=431595 RepID=K3WD10_GLOUD